MTPLSIAIIQYGLPSKDLHTRASNISRSALQSLQDVVKPHLNIMQLSLFGGVSAILTSAALQVLDRNSTVSIYQCYVSRRQHHAL